MSSNNNTLCSLAPWPAQWVHGSNGEPRVQAHRVCNGLYAIRQSKLLNFEGNFIYLFVGEERAILFDTGAVDTEECGLIECIESILFSLGCPCLPLVVAHTHSHGDHVKGDVLFARMQNAQKVGQGVAEVSSFFGIRETGEATSFELGGGRCLDIFFIPGHFSDHIAVYDHYSGVLLTGDFLYRGRLYVEDRDAFLRSAQLLDEYANKHPVTAVLGAHIEMTSSPGVDYPEGTRFQPDEPPLSMDVSHIRSLRMVVEHASSVDPVNWGVIRTDDFIVVPPTAPSSLLPSSTPLRVALLRKVFPKLSSGPSQTERLTESLLSAATLGATMVVLPELPMDEWYPRVQESREVEVCEKGMQDERVVSMSESARRAGVVLVGGALMRADCLPPHLRDGISTDLNTKDCQEVSDDLSLVRNVTLVFNPKGVLVATHLKRHLPKEVGFYEGCHFTAAPGVPSVMRGVIPGVVMGVQTCSDIMRPSSHALAAMGAGLLLNPRATEAASSEKWQRIVSGLAATTAAYILSVPRPSPEGSLDLGGHAFAVSPTGEIIVSSAEEIITCDVDLLQLGEARSSCYPGYLDIRAEEYAQAWQLVAAKRRGFKSNF